MSSLLLQKRRTFEGGGRDHFKLKVTDTYRMITVRGTPDANMDIFFL